MAAETGIPSVYLEHQLSHDRSSKKTQGSVIDKLRHRNSQTRTWNDSIKSVRNFVTERKTQPEKTEASGVQECLDTLQKAIKVISQETLKERLDLIGRQLGLNTEVQDQKVSLGTDVFHVEVLLGDEGTIASVKLANQGEVVECPALKDILMKGDFPEFIEHLQGLQSIYQVTNDEKLQSKAFLALQALEKDLNQLAQFQSSISGVANYIHKCPLGIMLPRLAGKPMKLIYFVSPYDLLDKKSLTAHPLTVEAITENFLGQSVTVCIESVPDHAPANKLQTMPLMNVSKTQDGKSKINSMLLPASFVLVLPQSMPVSLHILQKITSQTGLEIHTEAEPQSLCSLVLEAFSGGAIKDCKELYVSLPDQQHIYFLDSLNGRSPDQQGVMVSRIPFTHPTHVPQILNLMRQQLLFNIVIASCIRPEARKDNVNSIVFEVTAVSLQQLTIVFEHPAYDSMVTVDVDLSDITNLKCRVSGTNPDQELCSDDAVSRVFQRSMSIPVMLRWLITKGRAHLDKLKEAALAAERERLEKALFLKEMQHRQAKLQPTTLPANRPPPQPPHPPPLPPPPSYLHHHHSPMHIPQGQLSGNGQTLTMHPGLVEARTTMPGLDDFGHMADSNNKHPSERVMSIDDEHAHNPLLSTLLDEEKLSRCGGQADLHDSPMLSRLLDDNTSVATTVIPMNCKLTPSAVAKRVRKRKHASDFGGPSPKHRVSDTDPIDHLGMLGSSIDIEMGATLIDQGLPNPLPVMGALTPTHGTSSYHHQHPVLNHASKAGRLQSNVIDLTEAGLGAESSLKKLADMDKHFIHKDVKTEPDLSMLLNEAENPNRIPNILQNSPSGSKNENASTSLEVYLKGSGEVGRAKDFDPSDASSVHSSTTLSKLSSLLLASADSLSPNLSIPSHKVNATFFSDKLGSEETFAGVSVAKPVSDGGFTQDMKPSPASLRKGTLRHSSSVEIPNDKQITSGLFEKFDIPRQQQPSVKTEAANSEMKSHPVEGKVSLKLKVGHFKPQNSMKPYVKSFRSVDETDLVYEKSNSIGTFDFKSDEDDDDPAVQLPSDRYVYTSSSSPPRGQISSSKQKQINDYVPHKSDKTKKKERRSGNITKRKRDKDESKREKKRKKNEHFIQESVYRTVENDTKADFKLKIWVSKKHVSDKSNVLSDGKVQSYEIKKRSLSGSFEKPLAVKQEDKEQEPIVSETVKEKDAVIDGSSSARSTSSKLTTTIHKSSPKSGSKSFHSSVSTSKTDPKLVTKATIRLKPVMLPSSGSTVNISQTGPKASNSVSGSSKMDRRSASVAASVSDKRSLSHNSQLERRSSVSNLVDRRSSTQSSQLSSSWSSTAVSASTAVTSASTASANLSLSSILPNAPTISKIASMPRIPKLSSSSSNTSINRTSSLDPAAGSVPTSAGTKSNNSYTVGPAGRPNLGAVSGVAGGRSSAGISGMFNYNSRPSTPGSTANSKSNFNGSRPPGAAQTSPLVNSGQSGPQRPSGPRAHTPSAIGNSHKPGVNSSNSHKPSGTFTSSFVKGATGSSNSPNMSQKTHSSGAKVNNSISSKVSSNFTVQKSMAGSGNSVSGQRHNSQNAHSGSNMRTGASSSSVSPNTTGLTKSPNSGKSPNLTNASKSPSLNSASKSPNIPAANKSPNITSSNAGRSPNINRSPSTSISAVKPTPSPSHSGKSAVSVSHKHLSSLTKPSGVSRSSSVADALKSHTAVASRRSFISSGSSKSFPTKTGNKTTVSSSNSQQGNGKSVPITSSNATSSVNSKISSTSASSSSSNVSVADSSHSTQKSRPNELHATSVPASISTSSSPPLPLSPVKSNNPDHSEPNQDIKGSKSLVTGTESLKATLPEKSPASVSSTSNTVRCADSVKSLLHFSSGKGRKNSLSAIVDKLKHNAVGSGLDSPGVLATFSDSPSGAGSKAVSLDAAPDLKPLNASTDSGKEDLKKESATTKHLVSADRVNKKHNHVLENDKMNAANINSSDGDVGFSSKCVQSDTSDKLLTVVNCDRSRLAEERTSNLPCLSDTENGLVRTRLKDLSALDRDKPSLDTQDSNRATEKPTPLKIPLPVQSFSSSPTQSPAVYPCNTCASPQPSPFQTSQSPALIPNSSPLINMSSISYCEQVFKMPSVKPAVDNHNEIEPSEMLGIGCETQTKQSEDISFNTPNDNCDRSSYVEKRTNKLEKEVPSTLMSSPLSDISSPDNGLIIDDVDSRHLATKNSDKFTGSNVSKTSSPKSCINENNINVSVGSPNSADSVPLSNSPKTSWPLYMKSPTLSKSSSGASASKESDSPCPIDDDLMDVALGFGSC